MAKETEIDVWIVLFWIIVGSLVLIILWRAFGSSPTVEAVAFFLTILGVWLGVASMKSSKKLLTKLEDTTIKLDKLNKLDQLDTQSNILQEIKDLLERKL